MEQSLFTWMRLDLQYSSTHPLTSVLDGGQWSALLSGRFTPRERVSGTQWIGDWVGTRTGLNTASKRKIPSPRRKSRPDHPIVQTLANHWTIKKIKETIWTCLCVCVCVSQHLTSNCLMLYLMITKRWLSTSED